MKKYINTDGNIIAEGSAIELDGMVIFNPTAKQLATAGYSEYTEPVQEIDLDHVIADKIQDIQDYDVSPAVNSFKLNGNDIWLDKATRVGLVNAINARIALGYEQAVLGLGEDSYTVDCQLGLQMLYALEDYALSCYNTTLAHIKAVKALTDAEDVAAYNHTTGYPEHLTFII